MSVTVLSQLEVERYSRHLLLPEVGVQGQLRLRNSSVLCIGAGGLGSPLALYLAAAGVGRLGVVDFDSVEYSNLQRQILHSTAGAQSWLLLAIRLRPSILKSGSRLLKPDSAPRMLFDSSATLTWWWMGQTTFLLAT